MSRSDFYLLSHTHPSLPPSLSLFPSQTLPTHIRTYISTLIHTNPPPLAHTHTGFKAALTMRDNGRYVHDSTDPLLALSHLSVGQVTTLTENTTVGQVSWLTVLYIIG